MEISSDRPWFKFWPKGVPRHIDYPEIPLSKLLNTTAAKYPDRVAFSFLDQNITFKQLDILTDKVATALNALGKLGDRAIIFAPNLLEHVAGYYGIVKAGQIVSSISPLAKEIEVEHHLNSIEAETIIVDEERLPLVENVRDNTNLKNVILIANEEHQDTVLFSELANNYPRDPPKLKINPKEDIAAIQFTGGTTGMPKGAMMTHWNLVSNAIVNATWFNWTDKDVVLDVLPLYHTWGACCCMHSPIYVGARTILFQRPPAPPNFDPTKSRVAPDTELWLQVIEKEKVTVWYGAATMFIVLVNLPELAKYDLSSLRYVKIGAMPIPVECKNQWETITGVPMILGYGLTEASPETHSSPPERVKAGTIGIPVIDTDAKIVDDEIGTKELPIGAVGELIIKGPQVMKGYWKDKAKTNDSIRDGWLYTGDIAKMDEEGYFYIVDRKKDLIKYKGYSVYSAEVENVVYKHPAVKECAVVGIPDKDIVVGEKPVAFIVLKSGFEPTKELATEIMKFVSDRIAPTKRIRGVNFIDSIPKTAVGKVLKRVLREKELSKAN